METIYGTHREGLETFCRELLAKIDAARAAVKKVNGMDPVEHCLSRIKSEESMREKCRRKGLPETTESALFAIRDAIGIRVVCAFLDDVYAIRNALAADPDLTVVEEKDYIRDVKPNGYRSLHMILRGRQGYFAEIQLRTISMDTWAALEHHIRYKKNIKGSLDLIFAELKRCADELASTDVSMQTIRDMILAENERENG